MGRLYRLASYTGGAKEKVS